jgi:hypothetical protein
MAMAKDKKPKKAKAAAPKLEIISGGPAAKPAKPKKSDKKAKKDGGGLESLAKVLDHPLVGDLLAVGALAAVAAIAESGANEPAKVKSTAAVKTAGKAAAAAIGARLLKEMSSGGKKASAKS